MRKTDSFNSIGGAVLRGCVTLVLLTMSLLPMRAAGGVAQCMRVSATDIIKGDTNNDGLVNMTDVTFLINIILGKEVEEYAMENADVNADGYINMGDVTKTIDIILGKSDGGDDPGDDGDKPPVGGDDANPGLPVLMPKR